MKLRTVQKIISLSMAATLLFVCFAGCTGKRDSEKSGISLFLAENITETETGTLKLTRQILKKYQDQTGISVTLDNRSSNYHTWIRTQLDAGNGPDLYTGTLSEVTEDYYSGYLYNFADLYLDTLPGTGAFWQSTLSSSVRSRMYLTKCDVPGFPSAICSVRILCNKYLFQKAGASVPSTWAELMTACRKLQHKGITPFAFPAKSVDDKTIGWFSDALASELCSASAESADTSKNGAVDLGELAKAYDEKKLCMTDEHMKQVYKLLKQFSEYWEENAQEVDTKAALSLFSAGKAAMTVVKSTEYNGVISHAPSSFVIETVPIPVLTKETFETASGKPQEVGSCPDVIYCINKKLADDPKKLEAAVLLIRYLTAARVEKEYAEQVGRMPASVKVRLPKSMKDFALTGETVRLPFFSGLNGEFRSRYYQGWLLYLNGNYSTDSFANYADQAFSAALTSIKAENNWGAGTAYGEVKTVKKS